ncbi:MAG: aconitate hydratase AcnA [Xanthomonadales bacterium]|nr:aconitate hydratase AcnA [Xanthomonadales bacterium]MDX2448779.1 aconitate hydratase AcnA [Desulfobacterales bacterium]
MNNSFKTRETLSVGDNSYEIFSLRKLSETHDISHLPCTLKILLENLLRYEDGNTVTKSDIDALINWNPQAEPDCEIAFRPARVLMQDFTGVPAVVDLAAMRDAMKALGGDPDKINPLQSAELVIDHSVQVDSFGSAAAMDLNSELEYQRNQERYSFLKWGQKAFSNFQVVPPDTGIVHQVNLEYLARVVFEAEKDDVVQAYPDTLVGTDSHTTMINGLGVLGWGVGGIEAEAAMLGQPLYMLIPEVVGFKLKGTLPPGATATDLVLTITEILRKKGVVGKFVEFYGEGLAAMKLTDRATIANMAPEYGATMGFFPVDSQTLDYLRKTGRSEESVQLVESYYRSQDMFGSTEEIEPDFDGTAELDLTTVVPSLAGPKRPQDRVPLSKMKTSFLDSLGAPSSKLGYGLSSEDREKTVQVTLADGKQYDLGHGTVAIAAITSCTNTSNPAVMIGAGLLAKKAVEAGLSTKPWVKTSLAPGSKLVSDYLDKCGLTSYLDALGFQNVGYGCTSCIGNSGPIIEPIREAVEKNQLLVASVLSGNRNFEGRVNPHVKPSYLASPPLVVAYALGGTVQMDLKNDPLGTNREGVPVFLKDIWPSDGEINQLIDSAFDPETYKEKYSGIETSNQTWNEIPSQKSTLFPWSEDSTYIQHPPFFENMDLHVEPIGPIEGARVLVKAGNSITTDHISPAGAIPSNNPAATYLREKGIQKENWNSFGSRRGNDRVMTRGTFGNLRFQNTLVPNKEGGFTVHFPSDQLMSIFDAAALYRQQKTPVIAIAGTDYGMGSSRDWAAKGTQLLGIKAVIAQSFERIHRSNLVGMGVLPLQFKEGENADVLQLDGTEIFHIPLDDALSPRQTIGVVAQKADGNKVSFENTCRIDTPVEITYYKNGGILHTVLRELAR